MLEKITINGQMYLGKVKESDGEITLSDALAVKRVDRTSIGAYLKRKNLDELETVRFTGMGTSVSKSDLTDEQEMTLDICRKVMKLARKKSESGLTNDMFDNLLGKL